MKNIDYKKIFQLAEKYSPLYKWYMNTKVWEPQDIIKEVKSDNCIYKDDDYIYCIIDNNKYKLKDQKEFITFLKSINLIKSKLYIK